MTMEESRNEMPVLTLDPFEEIAKAPEAPAVVVQDGLTEQAAKKQAEAMALDESTLSVEERRMVDDFASKIDLKNSTIILQYGAGAQKKIADFSETALSNVRSKDLGEIGELLSSVVYELKRFDEEEEKGFLGMFKKGSNKIAAMKSKYDKAEVNINKISGVLEEHQIQLMKDTAMLDKMYDLNKNYFKELSMYILAGKKKLNKVRQEELPVLMEKAQASNLPEDAQMVNDFVAQCDRFEKKVHDLELTRMVSIQMAPQIRLVQSNDTIMSEKIQSTLVNTIPLWKSQMVLALGITHSTQAAQAQREVTDMTNELLRKNAAVLKVATVETAKEAERSIVDIETLRQTNESLISTLDEVVRIQEEGRQKRREAEVELSRIEGELKNRLLQMKG
ncbi:toxic anion resistance protein [Kineothrix sp. MB12-C1]|uniref:toxic anion resistance protein n=1 Tax=Kineothrix sp. MB12-C1 TaxID=3070215 RepID=UPI0027D250D2|nr:toxic anion resistance protein [Kineothrix sp. MB12-C1]WMC94092.1 toxic anion resistance protein [Kineothrix sp. MB12-C1]